MFAWVLTLGEMVEGSGGIKPGDRLVIREDKLGHGAHGVEGGDSD